MFDLKKIVSFMTSLLTVGLFSTAVAQKTTLYVGTYTGKGGSDGVQYYEFDESNGRTSFKSTLKMSNPSFLAKNGQVLYAVNEDNEGTISAVDLQTGTLLNQLPTKGAHPCHVAISPNLPVLAVSNYSGGSLILFSIKEDGRLNQQEDFIQFEGSSVNTERQSKSHIHSAFFSKDGKRLFVSDLGADLIYVYEVKEKAGRFALHRMDVISVKKGGGPRHVGVAADAKTIYSVLELTGELAVFQQKDGEWKNTQTLPIYKTGFVGEHGAADIKISGDGRYVYATNRGDANVIVCYDVLKDKSLRVKDVSSTAGTSPRNINISKSGKWVFVTNQVSNAITVFKRNPKKGTLHAVDSSMISVQKPVCVIY